jgi:uncharacterized membrane protein YcaP (DUF421 family)
MEILNNQLDICIRNMIAIVILFIFTLLIGKRLISQLNFFDFIVGITIGSIASSLVIDRRIPISHGVISLIIWGLMPIVIAKITVISISARRVFDGMPIVIIENGKILEDKLKKQKYNINELLEELRLGGVFNISDVASAILETNGRISIQLKAQKQPATPADFNIPVSQQGLYANVIIDGKILQEQLRLVNHDKAWLINEMMKQNIQSVEQINFASVDSKGNFYIDLKEDKLETSK